MLTNIPQVKLGIIAVSRDCFIIDLSERRRSAIVAECAKNGLDVCECKTTVENEKDMLKAVDEVKAAGCNALVVFLGNFGPETPETLIAKNFDGPCMYVAAAEGDGDLINGRGDAYCGMLNCSYNLGLRGKTAYIPQLRDAPPQGFHPRVPRGHRRRYRQDDRRVQAHRLRPHRPVPAEDHHLRPPAPGLLRLQRPHQGPV